MNRPCCVSGCKARDRRNVILCHTLPKDEGERAIWIERIGLSRSDKRKGLRVCGRHFTPDDYLYNPEIMKQLGVDLKHRLKPKVVPTLFLPTKEEQAQPQTVAENNAATGAPTSQIKTPEPVRKCTCFPKMRNVTTQTVERQSEAPNYTKQRRCFAAQVNLNLKVLVPARTQTELPALPSSKPRKH